MNWVEDTDVMNAFDDMLFSMKNTVPNFLESIYPHAEPNPQWSLLFTLGRFVHIYNEVRMDDSLNHSDAFHESWIRFLDDPRTAKLARHFSGGEAQ